MASISRVAHRSRRLANLARSLRHGLSFRIPGKENLELPLSKPAGLPASLGNRLQHFTYAFSVYGSLYPYTSLRGLSIGVSCHPSRASVAVDIWEAFGGHLTLVRRGKNSRPSICWRVYGDQVRQIARMFSDNGRKRALLDVAAEWPSEPDQLKEAMTKLQQARRDIRVDFLPGAKIEHWSDFAELVDSSGHVAFNKPSCSLRIIVSHSNQSLLLSIPKFLRRQGLPISATHSGVSFLIDRHSRTRYTWTCQKKEALEPILQALLQHGLLFKKRNCEEALRLIHMDPQMSEAHQNAASQSLETTRLDPSGGVFRLIYSKLNTSYLEIRRCIMEAFPHRINNLKQQVKCLKRLRNHVRAGLERDRLRLEIKKHLSRS